MYANFCLNITINIFLQLMEKSKKDDYDYSVQYFNKFKNVGYKFNDLIYHIWESEVLTELCAPVEKKKNYWKALAKCQSLCILST